MFFFTDKLALSKICEHKLLIQIICLIVNWKVGIEILKHVIYFLKYIIIHSKYFPNSDWLKAQAYNSP